MTHRDKNALDFERELLGSTRPERPVTYYLLWGCAWICWVGSAAYGIWAYRTFQTATSQLPPGMPRGLGFPWMSLIPGFVGMAMIGVLFAALATIISLLYRIANSK
jgi:hypothetical protein